MGLARGRVQYGSCPAHQQASKVGIARLRDPPQARLAARAVLPRYQPDPGGELAPARELGAAWSGLGQGSYNLQHYDERESDEHTVICRLLDWNL